MYKLSALSVTYTAKLRSEMVRTIGNLKAAIDHGKMHIPLPTPERLPRRAWRVWYLKSPFRDSIRKKHYIFQDWRYKLNFRSLPDLRPVLSSVLGAATRETSSTVHFAWHFPGIGKEGTSEAAIQKGFENFQKKNALWLQEKNGGWRQQYAHWNFKQYVPSNDR